MTTAGRRRRLAVAVGSAAALAITAAGLVLIRGFWQVGGLITAGEEQAYRHASQLSLRNVVLRQNGPTAELIGEVHNAGPDPVAEVRIWYEMLDAKGVIVGEGSMVVAAQAVDPTAARPFRLVLGGADGVVRARCAIRGGTHRSDEWYPAEGLLHTEDPS